MTIVELLLLALAGASFGLVRDMLRDHLTKNASLRKHPWVFVAAVIGTLLAGSMIVQHIHQDLSMD